MNLPEKEIASIVKEISGSDVKKCMKCGKCSATCPAYGEMRFHPHQFVSMVAKGRVEELMSDPTVSRCLTCFACVEPSESLRSAGREERDSLPTKFRRSSPRTKTFLSRRSSAPSVGTGSKRGCKVCIRLVYSYAGAAATSRPRWTWSASSPRRKRSPESYSRKIINICARKRARISLKTLSESIS